MIDNDIATNTVDPTDIRRDANGTVRVIIRNSTAPGRLDNDEVVDTMLDIAARAAGVDPERFHSEGITASTFDQTVTITFYAD